MATSKRKQEEGKDFKERYRGALGDRGHRIGGRPGDGLKNVWCRGLDRIRIAVTFKALALNIKWCMESELYKAAKAKAGGAQRLRIGSITRF